MTKKKKMTDIANCCQGCRETKTLIQCRCGNKNVQPFSKTVCNFLKKLNKHLPRKPLPSYLPKKMKTY